MAAGPVADAVAFPLLEPAPATFLHRFHEASPLDNPIFTPPAPGLESVAPDATSTPAATPATASAPTPAAAAAPSALDGMAAWLRRVIARPWLPVALLALVCALSVGARVFHLDKPAEDKPGSGFIFDEKYYVNASRVIAGVSMSPNDPYATMFGATGTVPSPAGSDQNGEHPQLGKVIIAAGIRVLGDNPWGWRMTAVLFGTAALLLLFWLVRVAGGSSWLALFAVTLAATENLFLVSSRIAVLDIYCVPFMLAGAALYLRRHPVLAGLILGVGSCVKEFCAYALVALLLLEAGRLLRWLAATRAIRRATPASGKPPRPARGALLRRAAVPVTAVVVSALTYFAVLSILDRAVPPYHDGHRVDQGQSSRCALAGPLAGGCNHVAFMNQYAASLRGISGISSYPWQFWIDVEQINYYTITTSVRVGGQVTAVNTVVSFQGLINPVLLALALPALAVNLYWACTRRDDLSLLVCAWYVATWLPAEMFNLVSGRTTYLYYMVVTLPAVFIAVARLLSVRRIPRLVVGVWIGLFMAGFAILYPFRTLTGN